MADLSNCTVQELIHELYQREHVALCAFLEEDVVEILKSKGVEPTKQAIDYVFGYKLGDRMTEEGWEYIEIAVDDYLYELRKGA